MVRDLLTLTLALRYPHDRLHWLAVLRAPWCGLTLCDLHGLVGDEKHLPIMTLLRDARRLAALSDDGQLRVQRLLGVLEPASGSARRAAASCPGWSRAGWPLGGPASCDGSVDFDAAERTLVRLHELEAAGDLWQPGVLHDAMASLFAVPESDESARVQIMTLHKAKGLEFDTVIVPALDRQPRGDGRQLLNWFEATVDGESLMLLAPFAERNAPAQPLNELVRSARRQADAQEKLRLLYVACTRARHCLHLVAQSAHKADGTLTQPREQSLLHPLWPRLHAAFEAAAGGAPVASNDAPSGTASGAACGADDAARDAAAHGVAGPDSPTPVTAVPPPLQRLPVDRAAAALDCFQWSTLRPPQARGPDQGTPEVEQQGDRQSDKPAFHWAGAVARAVGTVVHRHLQVLAEQPTPIENAVGLQSALGRRVALQLQGLGVPASQAPEARQRVVQALQNTLSDDRGRWILDPSHRQARTEWALSGRIAGVLRRVVVDRTFIDADGTRWIVDFKTGDHTGSGADRFLDEELERYRSQLQDYADIIGRIESRPVMAGLYFPMLRGWREFSPTVAAAAAPPSPPSSTTGPTFDRQD